MIRRRYVITVDPAGARMRAFRRQAGAAGFETWHGVDMRSAVVGAGPAVDEDQLRSRYGRALAPGEIGCAQSHRMLIEHIGRDDSLADDDCVLVVEDDACFEPDFESVLPALLRMPFDLLCLHHGSATKLGMDDSEASVLMDRLYPLSPLAKSVRDTRFRVGAVYPDAWMLAVGYLVTKRAARWMSALDGPLVRRVADDYRVLADEGLRVCQVRPSLVTEALDCESVITATGRVLSGTDLGPEHTLARMRADGANTVQWQRKRVWLLQRDVATRFPWSLRTGPTWTAARRNWSRLFGHLPPRIRRLLRPGSP